MVLPPDQPVVVGKPAIKEFVRQSMAMPGFSVTWEPEQAVIAAGGDLGYMVERNRITFADSSGSIRTQLGKAVTIWKKDSAGNWKCVIETWNRNPSDREPGAVRAAIEKHNANAERWYASGQIDSLASLFAEDAWQMPPNAAPLVGRKAVREFWAQAVQWGRWQFSLKTQEGVESGPSAMERGKYAVRFTAGPRAPPGMHSSDDAGNHVVLWRKESDGEWRITWDAPVSERAPAAAQSLRSGRVPWGHRPFTFSGFAQRWALA